LPQRHKHLIEEVRSLFGRLKDLAADTLTIGTAPDQATIDPENGLVYTGDTTVWNDIQTSLSGRRLASSSGKVDYNYENNSISFSPSGVITNINDMVGWSIQHPHSGKVNGMINAHIHWEQVDLVAREWTLRWRKQTNKSEKDLPWNTVLVQTGGVNDLSVPDVGFTTWNQITRLVDIDTTGFGLSCVVQLQLTRSDGVAGDIEATFVDAHVELDSLGSKEEYVK